MPKASFRNRCTIASPSGMLNLSIPLEGGRDHKLLLKDVKLKNGTPWQMRHWKSIASAYSRSPWFDFYREELEALYRTQFDFLLDWNLACFNWMADKMSFYVSVELSTAPITLLENGFEDWRNRLAPATINDQFPDAPRYRQVFEDRTGFLPNLSVLDYLFCAGNKLPR